MINTNSKKIVERSKRDTACQSFLKDHSGTPNALLGGEMEKEAYLDSLSPGVSDAVVIIKSGLGRIKSR